MVLKRQLDGKGLIYKDVYSGWYSITDECFYTDNQVITIPNNHGTSSATTVSIETGSIVEWQSEENYMFRLSDFQPFLLSHYTSSSTPKIFPQQHNNYIIQVLSETDLADLSISRPRSRLEWGVSVPGDAEQTVYVWFDALLVYLSGIGYPWRFMGRKEGGGRGRREMVGVGRGGMEFGWPVDLQVIGKDILRFVSLCHRKRGGRMILVQFEKVSCDIPPRYSTRT
jgi:methionyl-tRNA synthetase